MRVLAVVAALSVGSCDRTADCTEAGGSLGLNLTLAPNLYEERRTAEVELCQDSTCESVTTNDLYEVEGDITVSTYFPRFASTFRDGEAQLEVTLRDDAQITHVLTSRVDLTYNYPNGRECDGKQWLSGEVELR